MDVPSRRWSLLLVGKTNGIVAQVDHDWSKHPDHYEKVVVVEEEHANREIERLRAELAECRAKHMDDLLVLGETAKAERELRAELAECKRDMDADDLPDCRMCRFFRCDDIGPFCLEEDERICTDGDLFAGRFMPTQPVRLYEVNNAPALAAKEKE